MPPAIIGVIFHWLGGLASGSFYLPYRFVKKWSWETMWLVGGFFSWLIAPLVLATLLVPDVPGVLKEARQTVPESMKWAYINGALWGLGGLTFGLTMRYLGIGLGMAIALAYCAAFGTLVPPIKDGTFLELATHLPGQVILLGVLVCLAGIAVTGMAGMSKTRELPDDVKRESIKEFNFIKGMMVAATFSGIMSACFAFGLNEGKPIGDIALKHLAAAGKSDLWGNLPVLIVVLWGGFTTNFIWCFFLNLKNRSGLEYFKPTRLETIEVGSDGSEREVDGSGGRGAVATLARPAGKTLRQRVVAVPMLANYTFAAIAGTTWYFQFFFYSMGQRRMGEYDFSSWTLHMSSIIIFSSLWGIALKEWKGTSAKTKSLVFVGILVLVMATVVVGYGNYMNTWPEYAKAAAPAAGH